VYSPGNNGFIGSDEVYSLFCEATQEAEARSPGSPAVALGILIRNKLGMECEVPIRRAILAAQLLMPLCPNKRRKLHQFVQSRALAVR